VTGWNGTRKGALVALVLSALVLASGCATLGRLTPTAAPGTVLRTFVFPVAGKVAFTDTFGAARSGGRAHQGQDLIAAKRTPVVATVDGTVTSLTWSNAGLSGNSLTITDADGWQYVYIHLNNDRPGTDDGANVYDQAFADGISKGQRVKAGELVAWVGDSGNAESAGSHLHFELHRPDGTVVNPYGSLLAARRYQRPDADRVADSPAGVIDAIVRAGDGSVRTQGWAIDAHLVTPVRVTVLVDGNPVLDAVASVARADLARSHPGRGILHGFNVIAITAGPGTTVCVVAHGVGGGGSSRLGCATVA
jgi:hypothetical protein